jgi:PAS domain S-box-containing protein
MPNLEAAEYERIKMLHSYEIMDSEEESEFDNLVRLAAQICKVPFAKLNFLDDKRQWSKANYGNDIKEMPRQASFCHYTVQNEDRMIVEDTRNDQRFSDMAFVKEEPKIRFYAGVNIVVQGYNIGTICVLGQKPQKLSEEQLESLHTIANEIETRLELKKKNRDLATTSAFLEASVEAMLIVNPEDRKIEQKNDNGRALLPRLIALEDYRPLDEIFPNWDYLQALNKWQYNGVNNSFSFETSLPDQAGKRVYLKVNTAQKYDKWLITFQDITDRKLSEENLKEEKRLSDAIINALPLQFYMFDEAGKFIRWNKKIEETTGYSADELREMNPADFFRGEDKNRILEYIQKTMDGYVGNIQADLVHKDGRTEPFLFHAIRFINKNQKFLIGAGESVAGQVAYQNKLENLINEKEVLLQEVHHRVKNNLAVISGFLQLEELISEDEDTQSVLSSNYMRVKSMAMIHEQLYKANDFSGIEFDNYLKEMLVVIRDQFSVSGKDIEMNLQSDAVYMNLNQAVPLALIINELVTNAFSFAFEGRNKGSIKVLLSLAGHFITVSVKDDGIGLPEDFVFEESPTLGTTLVMSYSEQLNAKVSIDTGDDGTCYKLQFENKINQTGSNFHIAV